MLGKEVDLALTGAGLECIGSDREVDITDPEAIDRFTSGISSGKGITFMVNASAYTAVDKAEEDSETAFAVNHQGVHNLADCAARLDIPLLHISTDYVFNGKKASPLLETDKPDPIGVYGRSKLAGEEALRTTCRRYYILRTAWLYGLSGPNFVYTMLKLMTAGKDLKVIDDQHGSPTWTGDLARLIVKIISMESSSKGISENEPYGTYHFSNGGETSWYEFAREIKRLGVERGILDGTGALNPCGTEEYPTPAARPEYSLLSKVKVKKAFGLDIPEWQDSLERFFGELEREKSEISHLLS